MSRTLAQILIDEAPVWGVQLARRGDMLAIRPAGKCDPEFKELLREHKVEILELLEAEDSGLPRDQVPWLHVSRQILAGEFEGANASTVEALKIGVRGIAHPLCKQALERLGAMVTQPDQ